MKHACFTCMLHSSTSNALCTWHWKVSRPCQSVNTDLTTTSMKETIAHFSAVLASSEAKRRLRRSEATTGVLVLSLSLSISSLSVSPSISVCLLICLPVCLSVWLAGCLFVCLFICLSVCLSVRLRVCLSVCLSSQLERIVQNSCLGVLDEEGVELWAKTLHEGGARCVDAITSS